MSQEIITQAIPDINFDVKKTKSFFHDNKLHIELFLESSTNVHCTQCLSSDIRIRGSKKRKIKHSNAAFNDILIIFNARQYICTECNINFKERLPEAYDKRVSLAIDHRVYEQLGDVRKSLSQIADDLDISPQYVGKILDELQSPRRLNLPKFLSIDEVYTKINSSSKYSCILFNPKESELIDMLPTRFKKDLRTYFNSIPKEERLNVKYVCIDMYEPYKEIIEEFLPSAVVSIDSFHVVKNLVDAVQSIRKRVQGAFANDYINRSNYRLFKRNNGLLVQRNIDFKKTFR